MSGQALNRFIEESNRIEGIERPVEEYELEAHRRLLACDFMGNQAVEDFVFDICGKRIRDAVGMDVMVGGHLPPPGGPKIADDLGELLREINGRALTPYEAHVRYETLHPFMDGNGRSGRAIWAWMTLRSGRDPYGLPFLHSFYYEALDAAQVRTGA